MKRSTCLLAVLALAPALSARAQDPLFTREQVLDVFTRFNPAVLEKARQDPPYQAVLDEFLASYRRPASQANFIELVALARNFDTSLQLEKLTQHYKSQWLAAKMTGNSADTPRRLFKQEVVEAFARIWAVTVQVRTYQLEQLKNQSAQPVEQPAGAEEQPQTVQLRSEAEALQAELNRLKKYPGPYVVAAADNYIASLEKSWEENTFSPSGLIAAQYKAQQARAAENLQIKSKNKKPIAK